MPAASVVTRSRDTEYVFRQNSDFWYLTGFHEPEAWLLLSNHPRYGESYRAMVVQDKDPDAEVWQGRRVGAEAALSVFSLDEAFELSELNEALLETLLGHDNLILHWAKINKPMHLCLMHYKHCVRRLKRHSRLIACMTPGPCCMKCVYLSRHAKWQ